MLAIPQTFKPYGYCLPGSPNGSKPTKMESDCPKRNTKTRHMIPISGHGQYGCRLLHSCANRLPFSAGCRRCDPGQGHRLPTGRLVGDLMSRTGRDPAWPSDGREEPVHLPSGSKQEELCLLRIREPHQPFLKRWGRLLASAPPVWPEREHTRRPSDLRPETRSQKLHLSKSAKKRVEA